MHRFHHSRGRILFEVFCAFVVAASCVGGWMQTGAWALLPAASVALLYGLVHTFDMRGRTSAVAAEPQRIDFASDDVGGVPADQEAGAPLEKADQLLDPRAAIEEAEPVVPAAPRAGRGRRAGGSRKGGGRRASAPKEAKVIEIAAAEEVEVEVAMPPEETEVAAPAVSDEMNHVPLAPLFEPEPYVRQQQRAVFGRKAG